MTGETLYAELHKRCIHKISKFESDLTAIDREWLIEHPGVPFIHVTRTYGTHLLALWPATQYPAPGEYVPYMFGVADRGHILHGLTDFLEAIVKVHAGQVQQWLYYDGQRLVDATEARARTIVAKHIAATEAAWKKATVAA